MKNNDETLSWDDVTLVPQYSEIASRSHPDTSVELGGLLLRNPIVSANMDTVSGPDMCIAMYHAGGIGALHRFMPLEENVRACERVLAQAPTCFVTIGANGDYEERAAALYEAGARNFIVDIAHGHSRYMRIVLNRLRNIFGDRISLMGGNIATPEATRDLIEWGADIVKVGVGGGSICKTRIVTGHGVPMFTAVLECAEVIEKKYGLGRVKLIADGGIRSSGDIVKAFVAGADAVMVGSLLAGADETPGESKEIYGAGKRKLYRGMASSEAQLERNPGSKTAPEGVATYVDCKGPVGPIVEELAMGLKSGMSYCGAMSLDQISVKAKWRRQSFSAYIEGTPHILKVKG